MKDVGCCDDTPWYESWYGPGSAYGPTGNYRIEDGETGFGYFNPELDQYNPYPYYNLVAGQVYSTNYFRDLPFQFESPYNPGAALTKHYVNTCCSIGSGKNTIFTYPEVAP